MLILPPHTSSPQHQLMNNPECCNHRNKSKQRTRRLFTAFSSKPLFTWGPPVLWSKCCSLKKKRCHSVDTSLPSPKATWQCLRCKEPYLLRITDSQSHLHIFRCTRATAGTLEGKQVSLGLLQHHPFDVHHYHYQRPTGNVICLADCRHVLDCSSTRKGISARGSVTGVKLDTPLRYSSSVLCAHRAGSGDALAGWWCPSIMIPWHKKLLLLTAMLAHEASQGSYFRFSATHQKKTTTYTVVSRL